MIWVVMGTGRCGSSAVAGVLHRDLGVDMGEGHFKPDSERMSYEDATLHEIDRLYIKGSITHPYYLELLFRQLELRGKDKDHFGVKSPLLSYTLPFYLPWLSNHQLKFVVTHRPMEMVVPSAMKAYRWSKELAEREMTKRLLYCGLYTQGLSVKMIDMSEQRTDEWIREELMTL